MAAPTSGCEVAGRVNQALKETLSLPPRRDDLLRIVVVDTAIDQNACDIVGNEPDVRLQAQGSGDQPHRTAVDRVVHALLVDCLSDETEPRIQRVQGIERVRARLGLFLHPLDQQLEHLHRKPAVAYATKTKAQRLGRDVLSASIREVTRAEQTAFARILAWANTVADMPDPDWTSEFTLATAKGQRPDISGLITAIEDKRRLAAGRALLDAALPVGEIKPGLEPNAAWPYPKGAAN